MTVTHHAVLTHVLVALFGMGSWVSVNSLWVELPVVVKELPEGWNLPAFLTVLIALGNIGPLAVTVSHRLCPPGRLSEPWLIRSIHVLSLVSSGFLAVFWDRRLPVAGEDHSVAYLILAYFLALGCCTSNVTFLPFMFRFPQQYVRSFFIGQGLSALFPCVLALAQGVGRLECRNNTWGNASEPHYFPENFSASSYFWGLFTLLAISALSFTLLIIWKQRTEEGPQQEPQEPASPQDGEGSDDSYPLKSPKEEKAQDAQNGEATGQSFWTPRNVYLLVLLGMSNALTNGVLPSVQTYSCLPYGPTAYHLSVVLSNIANPAACFIAMCVLCRESGEYCVKSANILHSDCLFRPHLYIYLTVLSRRDEVNLLFKGCVPGLQTISLATHSCRGPQFHTNEVASRSDISPSRLSVPVTCRTGPTGQSHPQVTV
ncbi:solute carrier family 52, riboflavin transporter, member 2, partial [Bombina bombina]|uniref:solute carrier family 52, riboflavin transporter, member 2 n=1 Tax=Bombina bombina TaxID=8345 RepID=UPI00235AB260